MDALVASVGARQIVKSRRKHGVDVTATGAVAPLAPALPPRRGARR